jgi:hypothetical protein
VENKHQKDQLISSLTTEFKFENRRNIETTDEIQIHDLDFNHAIKLENQRKSRKN